MVITKFVYRHSWKTNIINIIINIMKLKFLKKKILTILIVGLIAFFLIGMFNYNKITHYLLSFDTTDSNFLILYTFICFFYFLSPLPITLIILVNGFLFKESGTILSLFLVVICSYIIFSFSELICNRFSFNIDKILKFKKMNIKKFSKNVPSIFLSRYIIPYFFHNVYYGLVNIRPKIFILTIFFAELPMIFCLNSIGKSFKNFSGDQNYSIIDLLLNKNFNIPLFIIIFIFFLTKYINTRK
jgi:uncharacterized membrane protein YdjX (TVP38/TMEM64 family)